MTLQEALETVEVLRQALERAQARNAELSRLVVEQGKRIEVLERRLGVHSGNSHQPPSKDSSWSKRRRQRRASGRKPGGQAGHRGMARQLVGAEQVDEVKQHWPVTCEDCGRGLAMQPCRKAQRQQQWELPRVKAQCTEHRFEAVRCQGCGKVNRARVPRALASHFGPRLSALMATLRVEYRLSRGQIQRWLRQLCAVEVSSGAISARQTQVSQSVHEAVLDAELYTLRQPVSGMDETSWRQTGKLFWLWVRTSALVTVFRICTGRSRACGQVLLGTLEPGAVLVSDRYGVYRHVPAAQRQLCWAHLAREFEAMSEVKQPAAAWVGKKLLYLKDRVFDAAHRVRDGTVQHQQLHKMLAAVRVEMQAVLRQGSHVVDTHTASKCKSVLKDFGMYWTFLEHAGLPLTNNDSERVLRHPVVLRRVSHGTRSDQGSRFIERMLTVVQTLRSQKRDVLDFVEQALGAYLRGAATPSLRPLHRYRPSKD